MKIEDYMIELADGQITLAEKIRDRLKDGWTPIGGICWQGLGRTWAQALVKIQECKPCNEKEE